MDFDCLSLRPDLHYKARSDSYGNQEGVGTTTTHTRAKVAMPAKQKPKNLTVDAAMQIEYFCQHS